MPFGDTFKALSDPTRREILTLLKQGSMKMCIRDSPCTDGTQRGGKVYPRIRADGQSPL